MIFRKKSLATTISLVLLTSHQYVSAEEDTANKNAENEVEKIVVTGRKQEEFLQDTPLSISAFSASDITDSGISDARDIAALTPGLQINGDFGRNSERPVIRGISNSRPETPQPVGLFIDGVFIRTGIISSILDNVQRVEILKGPQSALYGRSTYGGVINYITKKPTDEFSGNFTVSAGQNGHQDISGNISGAFSDDVRAAIGGRIYNYDGEYDNINTNTEGARAIGEETTTAIHGSLNITPTDDLEVNIRGYYSKDEDGQFAGFLYDSTYNNSVAAGGTACPNVIRSYFCGEVSVPDYTNITTSINKGENTTTYFGGLPAQWDMRAGLDREVKRITGDATYALSDNFDAQWLFGYTSEDSEVVTNQSYSDVLVGNSFGSFPSAWVTQDFSERDYYSHEVRVYGDLMDKLSVLGGLFFYNEKLDRIDRDILEADLGFDGITENEEVKLFGLAEYAFTEDFSVTAEVGIYKEDVTTITASEGRNGEAIDETFDGADFRLTAAYHINDNTFIYGNVARGHKAGGFNSGIDRNDPEQASLLSYDEEVVFQYETGLKYSFDKGIFNIASYFLDLTDQQLSQVVILTDQSQVTVVQNIGQSEIYGLEASLTYNVTSHLKLSASYAFADTEITEGSDATHGGILGDDSLVGFKIPRVSKNTGVVSATYKAPIFGEWNFKSKLDGMYASSRYSQVHNLQETGSSFKVNLRAGLENKDYEVTVWAKNLFDDKTAGNIFRFVDPGDFRFFTRAHMVFLPRGRQVGITANVKF
jgi:outer membrane receptor protein involved in Fe transport